MIVLKLYRIIVFFLILFFSGNSLAKVEIVGKLPAKPLLYNNLLKLKPEDIKSGSEEKPSLGMVHDVWLSKIAETVKEYKAGRMENLGADHPIEYFNRKDAKNFLKPILKRVYNVDLDRKTINNLFPEVGKYKAETNYLSKYNVLRMNRVKEETYVIAKKLFNLTKGKTVVSIGHTPILLVEMLRAISDIAKPKDKIEIINVPFSGRADIVATHRPRRAWSSAYKNIITDAGDKNYRKFLDSLGFSPKKNKGKEIYFVDDSRGPALCAFLLFLTRWYRDERLRLPEINFASMRSEESLARWRKIRWKDNDVGDSMNLRLTSTLKFQIDTTYLDMDNHVLHELLEMQDNVRLLPSMNAINWTLDLQDLMSKYPRAKGKRLLEKYAIFAKSRAEIEGITN